MIAGDADRMVPIEHAYAGKMCFIFPMPTNPVKNVCTTPLVGGQWKPGIKFKYDLHIVYNQTAPNIPLDSPLEPIKY